VRWLSAAAPRPTVSAPNCPPDQEEGSGQTGIAQRHFHLGGLVRLRRLGVSHDLAECSERNVGALRQKQAADWAFYPAAAEWPDTRNGADQCRLARAGTADDHSRLPGPKREISLVPSGTASVTPLSTNGPADTSLTVAPSEPTL
jgi:hypothetical protein